MQARVPGYSRGQGIAMMMEAPPVGGRHRMTASYGRSPDLSVSPRDALANEIRDVGRIYRKQGLYIAEIRKSLREGIGRNEAAWPLDFQRG